MLQSSRGSNFYWHHTDDLGNTLCVTDENGDVAERCDYQDFGWPEVYSDAGYWRPASAPGIQNPFLFNGRRWDSVAQQYDYRTRRLDPRAGRFTSRDKIGTWGDPYNDGNSSTYVGNNPWSMTDPVGLSSTQGPPPGNSGPKPDRTAIFSGNLSNDAYVHNMSRPRLYFDFDRAEEYCEIANGLQDVAGEVSRSNDFVDIPVTAYENRSDPGAMPLALAASIGPGSGKGKRKAAGSVANAAGNKPGRCTPKGLKWSDFLEGRDLDWRNNGKHYGDALGEAFNNTGLPRSGFQPTKWGLTKDGKSIPTEWTHPKGGSVNMDFPHSGINSGPDCPHIGWKKPGTKGAGHIRLPDVPAGRPPRGVDR